MQHPNYTYQPRRVFSDPWQMSVPLFFLVTQQRLNKWKPNSQRDFINVPKPQSEIMNIFCHVPLYAFRLLRYILRRFIETDCVSSSQNRHYHYYSTIVVVEERRQDKTTSSIEPIVPTTHRRRHFLSSIASRLRSCLDSRHYLANKNPFTGMGTRGYIHKGTRIGQIIVALCGGVISLFPSLELGWSCTAQFKMW